MKTLFDQTRIGTLTLRNRIIRSATWERMADPSGYPTRRLIELYDELSRGGTGLIITSATVISRDATTIPGILAMYDDSFIDRYRELTRLIHRNHVPVIMQLSHVGTGGAMWTPAEPDRNDLATMISAFGDAAYRAQQSGFDGVQIHFGHGFLLSRFMNTKKNLRTDEYGGSVSNRTRIFLEIYRMIRSRVGSEFPVLIKINCSDFEDEEGGVFDACQYICRELTHADLDAIEITGGTGALPTPPRVRYSESVFRDYAALIADQVSVPVILVGMNRNPQVMTAILNETGIEYFSLARPLLRQPDLVQIWQENPEAVSECTSCDACRQQPEGNVCPFR